MFQVSVPEFDDKESKDTSNDFHPNGIIQEDKKYRHNRLLRQQILNLERSGRKIQDRQNQLDRIVHRMEKQMKIFSLGNRKPRDNEVVEENLAERVGKLEETGRTSAKQIFNVSKQVTELGRLHLSMLQLLESVENLETKVDQNVPELQREISKMEFNMAQATSSLSLVKENQVSEFISYEIFSLFILLPIPSLPPSSPLPLLTLSYPSISISHFIFTLILLYFRLKISNFILF